VLGDWLNRREGLAREIIERLGCVICFLRDKNGAIEMEILADRMIRPLGIWKFTS
jgi:hypothetical protein